MEIYGVILSAGKSTRMGMPKALVKIRGRTFLDIIFTNMAKAGIDNVYAIVGQDEKLIKKGIETKRIKILVNPDFDAEQFASIKLAISQLFNKAPAIMFALVDHPFVKLETYKKLLYSAKKIKNKILIPAYNHKAGHPIIIPENTYNLFLQTTRRTAREVIHNHRELVEFLEVKDEHILKNINRKEELTNEV